METDPLYAIRLAVSSATKPEDKVQVSAGMLQSLLSSLQEQEHEVMEMDRELSSVKGKLTWVLNNLDCRRLEDTFPADEDHGDVFELFIGEVSDCGRIWGLWDSEEGAFYEPSVPGQERVYVSDVVYWRYSLPEPHEAFDIENI